MKDENKKCWNCCKYAILYTKGYAYFNQEKIGLCREQQKVTDKQDSCDKWGHRSQMKRNMRKGITLSHLEALLERLTAIEQIMREEIESDKN